jgi:5-methylcytosine-specific restriction endonuclease McrA
MSDQVACIRCGIPHLRSEMKPFEDGSSIFLYCPDCLAALHRGYYRKCEVCQKEFKASRFRKVEPFCPDCYSEEKLYEWRRVQRNLFRAQELSAEASLTIIQWIATLEKFDRLCAYCQINQFEVLDHIIPLGWAGGGTTVINCVPSCGECNRRKRALDPLDRKSVNYFRRRNIEMVLAVLRVGCYMDITRHSR